VQERRAATTQIQRRWTTGPSAGSTASRTSRWKQPRTRTSRYSTAPPAVPARPCTMSTYTWGRGTV
jgi:hypothetical protein